MSEYQRVITISRETERALRDHLTRGEITEQDVSSYLDSALRVLLLGEELDTFKRVLVRLLSAKDLEDRLFRGNLARRTP